MNLKNVMYTTGAAMALFGTTAVTTITANAAVSPTQQTQQAKSNDNGKTQQAKSNDSTKTQQSNAKANDADKSKTTSTAKKADTTPAKTQTATNTNANQDNGSKQSSNTADANKASNNNGSNNSTNANNDASTKTDNQQSNSTTFDQKAPRLTGSAYKSENAGFKTSVKNRHTNKDVTVNYSINTYESDGSASSKPFQIKIYKDGSLYKTIDASSGTATGSFSAPKGTYTLQVLTSQSTHYTGGLSVQ